MADRAKDVVYKCVYIVQKLGVSKIYVYKEMYTFIMQRHIQLISVTKKTFIMLQKNNYK